ncbi:MAG: hypothetical protein ACRD18_05275 [Terriglobia bacterium]
MAYKGKAQGETFEELLTSAEYLCANAILNRCNDNSIDVGRLFHGAVVVFEPIPVTLHHLAGATPVFPADQPAEVTGEAV